MKKILVIMLSIVMISAFAPVNVFAEGNEIIVIDCIEINNLHTPVVGERPDFNISVPENANYHLGEEGEIWSAGYSNSWFSKNGMWWENYTKGDFTIGPEIMNPEGNEVFENDGINKYTYRMAVFANPGYKFAENLKIKINGVETRFKNHYNYKFQCNFTSYGLTAEPFKYIQDIGVNDLKVPELFKNPDHNIKLPADVNYHIATREELNEYGYMDPKIKKGIWWHDTQTNSTLDGGSQFYVGQNRYYAEAVLVPDYGYRFSDENNIKINESTELVEEVNKQGKCIHIKTKPFTVDPEPVKDFSLGNPFIKIDNNTYKIRETGKEISVNPVVTDQTGLQLVENRDYTLTCDKDQILNPGVYTIGVKGKDFYGGEITKTLVVTPKPVTDVNVRMCKYAGGYDDAYITWNKVPYASGYQVYYRRPSITKNWTSIGMTTKTSFVKKDMYDGYKYEFKVVPYIKSGNNYYRTTLDYKVVSMNTLKKLNTPFAGKYNNSKVRVKWNNIYGESGYQISRSTKKTGTYIVNTYPTTTGNYRLLNTRRNTGYYYKVRAYKVIDGTKVFAPWSNVKYFKLS